MDTNKSYKRYNFFLFAYWYDCRWKKFVGATVKIWDLALNLSKQGNDVTIFLPKYHFDKGSSQVKIVEIPFLNLPFFRLLTFNLCLFFSLLFFYFKGRPEVVYVRRMASVIPGLYAKIIGAAFLFEVNDDPYRKDFHEGSKIAFRISKFLSEWQDEINLRLCSKAFVITPEIAEKIFKNNPYLEKSKLEIMPSGANTDLLKPLDKNQCRKHLKFSNKKKIVSFAGTLLEHQGIEILIQAAAKIIKKMPETLFLIIGEGPKKQDWINLMKERHLSQNFIFAGQISYENIPIWLGSADICVAPFMKSAGFRSPVKIFDYMACGKAVVASKISGTTDLFEKSGAIVFVEAENPTTLSEKIIELLSDEKKANKMGADGRKFILMNFDRKKFAENINKKAKFFKKTNSLKL